MSEFTFACTNCREPVQTTTEEVGKPTHCPICKAMLIVPPDPAGPQPQGARLSMTKAATAATSQPGAAAAAAASFYAARPVLKKKSKVGLIVGLSLTACAIAAGIYFYPTLKAKYLTHEDKPAATSTSAAADQTPTNEPPPPPELTTDEVLQKVGDTYKNLTDYAAKAQTLADIDVPGAAPGRGKLRLDTTSSLQLGRTNNYRLDWEQKTGGTTEKGAAWSSGRGNFVGYGHFAPGKVKTRQLALSHPADEFILSGTIVADLFFTETNNLAAESQNFTKTNEQSPNGQACYVLTGEANHQNLVLWVDKNTFLISQVKINLGETLSDEESKKIPSSQRGRILALSKLKGTVTETYSGIQVNKNLLATAFESSYQPVAGPAGAPAAARPRRSPSSPSQLANPRRGGQAGQ